MNTEEHRVAEINPTGFLCSFVFFCALLRTWRFPNS